MKKIKQYKPDSVIELLTIVVAIFVFIQRVLEYREKHNS